MRTLCNRVLLALLLVAATAGSAWAQSLDEASISRLSDAEKVEAARAARTATAEAAERVDSLREQATEVAEETTQIRCLNEASASLNGFLQVASDSFARLQAAVEAGDERSVNHQYMMVMISSQRASGVETQAQQCAGSALRFVGDTQTSVEISDNIAEFDATDFDDNSGGAFIFVEELPPNSSAER